MRQPSLRLHQLARALDERFAPHVHHLGVVEGNADQVKLRSRALTAMAAHMVAGIPDKEAARRVTDYFHDDGIDGFAVKTVESGPPTIYLIQAKWSAEGKYNFKERDATALPEGLAKLLLPDGLHPDNLLRNHLGELRPAINMVGARFVLVWATSGQNAPSPDIVRMIEEKLARFERDQVGVEYEFLLLEDFFRALEADVARTGVTVTGGLLRSRMVDEQHESLQGTISAAELGKWHREHGRRLFDDNVRVEMESEVNKEIVRCLLEEPQNFWYFNNGVTALCEDWERAPVDVRETPFRFDGLRIVNGAQTVSSISAAMGESEKVARAQVPIRFIKLKTTGPEFGARITFATNRSNPMLPRDLLAMDHVQQRLRDEFELTWGFRYAIRANDDLPATAEGCSVLEAVIAMAVGRHEIGTLAVAKDDIASLWPGDRELYGKLFNDGTSVVEVWNRVRALRLVMNELHRECAVITQREKAVGVLGDLFIAHIVFRCLGNEGIGDIASKWEDRLSRVAQCTREARHALFNQVDAKLASRPPAPGKGFSRVSSLLRNEKWLAKEIPLSLAYDELTAPGRESVTAETWPSAPEFRLDIRDGLRAKGRRCDGGFLVYAGSAAAAKDGKSLTTPQILHRRNLRDSLGFVSENGHLRLSRDALFGSPSQAADVLQGHSVNGADGWATEDGMSYNQVVKNEGSPG
ncbi:AIPR family protein [Spirillospora sp. CA-142024]|uniref:AIPR family protein n=1 Tax=Spirillospora sp. CA-142024 TaxID=3240036 RepID=UPI003D8F7706